MRKARLPRRPSLNRHLLHAACSLLPLVAAGLISTGAQARPPVSMPAATALPVPSNNPALPFVYSGTGSQTTSGNAMTVTQTTPTLGLNWNQFNIGRNASVNFVQPAAGSRVLNRIWDQNPSVIMGNLKANGQVYLINQNGILFGAGSQVNVGGLVASALNVSDDLLNNGLPVNLGDSLGFSWSSWKGADATGFASGFVAVDSGATISSGGRVLLLAPALVENNGTIRMDIIGETILAAGDSVLLTVPANPYLRGLLVQTQSFTGKDAQGNNVTLSGTAANGKGAVIDGSKGGSNGGVVTLAALTVNQQGTVSAGKAVNLNGQIMLVASMPETPLMTINQSGDTAQIDWSDGFALVDAQHRVDFIQPDAGSRVLNRIGGENPSVITGNLFANGQVYLVNQNGIRFGKNAQVIAGGLVASALNVSDDLLNKGLPVNRGDSLGFSWSSWQGADATGFANGVVAVDSGATISSIGRVALLAPSLAENNGTIRTGTGGETILAAGDSVLLTVPDKPNLRGLLVQTQSFTGKDAQGNNVTLSGQAANRSGATIDGSDGGVVTLAAQTVNQEGTVKAGKAVNLNGQNMLVASMPETPLLTINQSDDTAQIDWPGGFAPVDANHAIEFVQPDAGSRVLNRIGGENPTVITGSLKANGQVYLVNQNGIRFGKDALVNVGGLVASAMSVSDDLLKNGLPANNDNSSSFFSWLGDATGNGSVVVDSGATINSTGWVALLAPTLAENLGTIRTGLDRPIILTNSGLPVGSSNFVFSGAGTQTTSGNAMTVTQTTSTLGLNWDQFNIGRNASVNFVQPDAGSRVLNRIWDQNPSHIMGHLTANGQVYFFNQNGILFDVGSQVNVGGLVASALSVSDDLLTKGLPVNPGDSLNFSWQGDATSFANGFVALNSGAQISSSGRVVLLAPALTENNGAIRTGTGFESILAAGGSVLLSVPNDSTNLHGLQVQTQSISAGKDALGNNVILSGQAANRNGAVIDGSDGGVVTLAALKVNQEGTLKAGKAANLNGQIMLVSSAPETPLLTINQSGDTAQIDWSGGFAPVDAQHAVEFVQPSAGAVAYNFINDPSRLDASGNPLSSAGRSTIDGSLKANGQIFLINEKGIDFGTHADVKAANFVASGLGMNPDIVANGIYSLDWTATGARRAFYLRKDQWVAQDSLITDPDPKVQQAKQQAEQDKNFADQSVLAQTAFSQATVSVTEGARITTAENGYALLIGSTIDQHGTITTPHGQTLLAAGADVYLKPPLSAGMRGFTAEVNPLYVVKGWKDPKTNDQDVWGAVAHGSIANTGTINAPFGDISLVGFNIEQSGTLSASTSVTANGSIHLVARDQVAVKGTNSPDGEMTLTTTARQLTSQGVAPSTALPSTDQAYFISGKVGGQITLGAGSVTQVTLDGSDGRTITGDQPFIRSSIDVLAKAINVEGAGGGLAGAALSAKGGAIRFTASDAFDIDATAFTTDPITAPMDAAPAAGVGVFIGEGAKLDVSGAMAQKSVADLFIPVELRGDEFANNPVQRNGALRGKKATVDLRDPVAIADLSGYFGKVGQILEERAATGGDIALNSLGSVIVKSGATLDVSGGQVNYAAGQVTESRASTRGGASYRLNDAPANLIYTGLIQVTRQEQAYTEGKSAGSVELNANSIALDGTLLGNTVRGQRQVNLTDPASDRFAVPLGARLTVVDAGQHYPLIQTDAEKASGSSPTDAEKAAAYGQAQIAFVADRSTVADALNFGDSAGPRLELSQSLVQAGFSRFDIKSDGSIDVPSGVNLSLAPGGQFTASGRQVDIGGNVTAPGGSITISTRDMSTAGGTAGAFPTEAKYSNLLVDGTASLSTAGLWINDLTASSLSSQEPKPINGGSISLTSAYDLIVGSGSRLDVSGGGFLDSSGKLTAGNAGSISLGTGRFFGESPNPKDFQDSSLFLDGSLSAYALGKGGSLTISTSKVLLGDVFSQDSRDWTRDQRLAAGGQVGAAFGADFLNQGGFFSFKFVGYDGVDVKDGAILSPKPLSWILAGTAYRYKPSGSQIGSFAQELSQQPELRAAPTTLSLATGSLYYGNLRVGDGAYLGVDPLGSITLESKAQLTVLGTLEAPAGTLRLMRTATNLDLGFSYYSTWQSRSLFLGPQSQLLAEGVTKLDATTRAYLQSGLSADALRAKGLYRGQVLDGGYVQLDAGLGYLVTAPGSVIDVGGAQDAFSVAHMTGRYLSYAPLAVGSAGGEVDISARDGMFLDGSFRAAGADKAPGGIFSLRFGAADNQSDPWAVANSQNFDAAAKAALTGPRVLTLLQATGSHTPQWPAGVSVDKYLAGSALLDPIQYNGKASLDLSLLARGGFGSWYLQSQDKIAFSGKIDATVSNQLRLDSPAFAANPAAVATDTVSFTAAAIQIGNYDSSTQSLAVAATPEMGAASFSANARDLALVGNFTWSGFGVSNFTSQGDIHFDSMANTVDRNGNPEKVNDGTGVMVDNPLFTGRLFNGMLKGAGTVNFAAAQLYPSTFSDFTVDLLSDGASRINITQLGSAGPILSADGRIEFKARDIEDHGTVTAPLGQIAFTAPDGKVNLWGDSVSSVAANGLIPLGTTTLSGRQWVYEANSLPSGGILTTQLVVGAPEKAIVMDGAVINVATGATLNISGGGEAAAWEFTPGPGGKTDALAPSASASPTMFAILPGWQGGFAPADNQAQLYYNASRPQVSGTDYTYDSVPSLKPGDQIQLSANPLGLTGNFTLLPASYARLPGAVLVTIKSVQDNVIANPLSQADGSWLVTGTRLAANADGGYSAYSQRPLTLELASQATVLQRSSYQQTTASGFFFDTAGAQAPGDAGRLAVAGRTSLMFDPVVLGRRDSQIVSADARTRAAQGTEIDLAAPKLAVVDSGTSAPDGTWSTLDKDKLNALGVSSLLLGGLRSVDGKTTNIETVAGSLRVATSGDTALKGPELLLTASNDLTVAAGSKLAATADAPAGSFALSGDGAFLRVAGGDQATLQRQGNVVRAQGDLKVEVGASVSGRALILDATHTTAVAAGTMRLANEGQSAGNGGSVAIGAGRINLVGDDSTPADGLMLSNADLAAFGNPDQIRLTSYSTLDLYGPAALGTSGLKELIVAAAGIAGHGGSGTTATIQGESVRFENPNPTSATFTAGANLGGGKLAVAAQTVTFGDNATQAMRDAGQAGFALRGFSDVTITAAKEVRFEGLGVTAVGNAGAVANAGAEGKAGGDGAATTLTMDAGRVVAATGSNHLISASGAATIKGGGNTGTLADLGGSLEIDAKSLDVSGRIEAPAGKLTLAATGSAAKDSVSVEGVVTAEGAAVAYADTFAYAPAGQIMLKSANGDVSVNDGAIVSVSAVAGGDAGGLSLLAQNGTVSAGAATLRGWADSGDSSLLQGQLTVDAMTVNLDQLAGAVQEPASAGGRRHFTGQWDVRQRSGDLTLAKDNSIEAALIRLAADAGSIDISGTLDASGASGGNIELYAKSATDSAGKTTGGVVTLESTGKLLANATEFLASASGTRGRGGNVTIGVDGPGSDIVLKQGGLIDVSVASMETTDAKGNSVTVSSAAPAGQVTLRAPRITNTADLSKSPLSKVTGTATTTYQVTSGSTLVAGSLLTLTPEVNADGTTTLSVDNFGSQTFNKVKPISQTQATAVDNSLIVKGTPMKVLFDGANFWVTSIGATSYLSSSFSNATRPTNKNTYTVTVTAPSANPLTQGVVSFTIGSGSAMLNPAHTNPTYGWPTLTVKSGATSTTAPLVWADGTPVGQQSMSGSFRAVYTSTSSGNSFVVFSAPASYSNGKLAQVTAQSTTAVATKTSDFTVADTSVTAYSPGTVVSFTANAASAGTTTLNVNGLGAVNLLNNGGKAVKTGDIKAGEIVTAVYDGSIFQMASVTAGNSPRPDYGTGVAIEPIASTIEGTSSTAPVVVDAFKTYSVNGDANIDTARLSLWKADNFAFMKQAPAIAANLTQGRSDSLAVSVRPGIDFRATGDITVGTAIDFNGSTGSIPNWHYGAAAVPGSLTLRAGGNLTISAPISDGFGAVTISNGGYQGTDRDGKPVYNSFQKNPDGSLYLGPDGKPVLSSESWSYQLVAGADAAAANPLAVKTPPASANDGNIQVNTALVRTGTGSISLAAGGSVTLADGAAVYTAGIADTVLVDKYGTDLNLIYAPNYFHPIGGSSGPQPDPLGPGIAYQTGDTSNNGARNFYPLGGGDVNVSAGGSIIETTSGAPSDWLVRYGTTYNDTQWYPRIASFLNGFAAFGGGNVTLRAGADISNVMAAVPTNGRIPGVDGVARADLVKINGGGNLDVQAGGSVLGGTFYAESGNLRVQADKSIASSAPASSTAYQIAAGLARIGMGDTQAHIVAQDGIGISEVFNPLSTTASYKDSSGKPMSLLWGGADAYHVSIGTYTDQTSVDMLAVNGAINLGTGNDVAPSRVKAATLNADNGDISGSISQVPGSFGQLDLLAAKGIQLGNINQYDIPADKMPSVLHPTAYGVTPYSPDVSSLLAHSSTPWHANDAQPSRVVALNGDISGPGNYVVVARFNEPVQVQASGDIRDGVSIISQHLNASDVTSISAGGSIVFPTSTDAGGSTATFQVDGPGRLEVIAGKNVDLGNSVGIVTTGNLVNSFLTEGGASVLVLAGATPDYAGFRKYLGVGSDVSEAALRDSFYLKLRDDGRAALAGGGVASYEQGRETIKALFPTASVSGGNIDFFNSEIKTEQGGGIDLLAPGGGVTVGIANPGKDQKPAADQGLFTIRGGDISVMVSDSFLVNQSRVFTLDGGNILVWADQGSINAGNGAKTVSATPPPVLVIRNGQAVLDTSGSIAGSGIGALASKPNTPPSDLDLFAPKGIIDAGDAGLRSTGNVNLGAQVILNANNIQAAGTISGAPVAVAAPSTPAPPSNPASTEQSGNSQALQAMSGGAAQKGILTVEVLGTGDDGGTTLKGDAEDDVEDDTEGDAKKKKHKR